MSLNENSLATVWPYVQRMLDDGISIIPVRDKEELYNGTLYGPKTPCLRDWKQYQSTRPTKEELWYNTERANTTAFALICGRVSGNLFIIDIDVKYKEGCDAVLFGDLAKIYPQLFTRLRIHKTPSGGYHIIYRIIGDKVPGNEKLASRYPTTDELATNPKDKKPKAFIETRGEGGYAVAPPSLGYSVHQDRPIPEITWEEHCSIINLCRSYNEVMKVEKAPKSTQYDNDYYSENPWDHFNNSPAAEDVLVNHGWKIKGQSNQFIWYTRPGKDQGVSASWNKSKRIYYIFTSSTEFDPSTGYQASTALAILKFNGDKKQAYRWLVDQGYGKINPEIENRLITSKAAKKESLPANASAAAREALKKEVERIESVYPHGVFWEYDNGKPKILREFVHSVAAGLGFRDLNGQLVRVVDCFIYPSTEREFLDTLKAYIQEEDYDNYCSIANAYEAFMQRSGRYTMGRVPVIPSESIQRDSRFESVKFFSNGYVTISPNQITFSSYENYTKLVHANRVQKRAFIKFVRNKKQNPLFETFLDKAVNFTYQKNYTLLILGHLIHEFKDDTNGFIVVLTELVDDPNKGGGSGKNIFCSLLKNLTTVVNSPGSQKKFDEKFLQVWNGEKVFCISDVPKHFDFAFLKELSTGTGVLKKLFKDEISIGPADMPKFIIQTNFSYEITDGGVRRRIIPLEFTDFFTKEGGVDTYFNAHFPNDWTDYDWAGFDDLIFQGIQLYMKAGCKLKSAPLSESGWMKQFEQTYGQLTREFIQENISNWTELKNIDQENFNIQYLNFCNANQVHQNYRLSAIKMNRALNDWCIKHRIDFMQNHTTTFNGITKKCRRFLRLDEELPESW